MSAEIDMKLIFWFIFFQFHFSIKKKTKTNPSTRVFKNSFKDYEFSHPNELAAYNNSGSYLVKIIIE